MTPLGAVAVMEVDKVHAAPLGPLLGDVGDGDRPRHRPTLIGLLHEFPNHSEARE
ncbi:hypothetical protein [Candidatus Mycolicibacterium alkanivorans]|uniref:Uncharacterized protein n=1 Tax=Candidatus Mycolicibacterium alkanivorans TaxID=2954114 RepID=A0ABS9YRV8_9MYCO|nr:hypothetical protein [Candidatus Mycolicibacterium alkanivorans]MCI4673971.1 hypothetical protein [Candidatus Mycolicibacterium alkanivorans]